MIELLADANASLLADGNANQVVKQPLKAEATESPGAYKPDLDALEQPLALVLSA